MLSLKIFFASLLLILVALLALSVRILLKKNGQFPNTHIGHNPNMQKRGIVCAITWDKREQCSGRPTKIDKKNLKLDISKLKEQ
ncbi:MAG TPA: hypothetical protein PK990_09225 [Salinivirgaceae bacterium]|nr:hypothetical protein [Salinivirgaceae bacterium]